MMVLHIDALRAAEVQKKGCLVIGESGAVTFFVSIGPIMNIPHDTFYD